MAGLYITHIEGTFASQAQALEKKLDRDEYHHDAQAKFQAYIELLKEHERNSDRRYKNLAGE
jgi:hypothetical protein